MVATEAEIRSVNLVRNLFTYARNYRQNRVRTWRRMYQLVHNKTWSPFRDSWMPSPVASETYPILAAMIAWMTDQRPQNFINPSVDPSMPEFNVIADIARDLEKVMETNWQIRALDAEVEKHLWDALTYGTGFLKCLWDNALEDGLGDATMARVDPFRLYPDPQATSFNDANFIIEARTMTLQELDRRWPGTGALDGMTGDMGNIDNRPDLYTGMQQVPMAMAAGLAGNAPRYGSPGQSERVTIAQGYDQVVTVYEAWIREHQVFVKGEDTEVEDSWRVKVVSGNRVLMDENARDVFGHGRHPYVRYVPTDLGEFWGVSLVEHLAPLQISLNRLLAAQQQHAELTGNPVLLEDSRSGIGRTKVVNKPGVRVTKSAGSEVKWLEPPQMSPQVMELVKFYQTEMERVSGLSAITRGASPQGRQARQVLDSVQEAAFVRVRLALRNLERTLREAGSLRASLIAENYTEPRIIAITGQPNDTPMKLKARHFYTPSEDGKVMPLKFSLWVQAGASMPTSRQARSQEAETLFSLGGIDRQALLEAYDYPGRQQILDRINQAEQQGAFQPPGARQRTRREQPQN